MNFALEELRQVDWLVIKIKQVPFLLFSCSLLFNRVVVVRVSFSALSLVNIRISLLLFPKPLAYYQAYFLRTELGKHRNLLFLFRRFIFSTSALAFSHRTLIHSTQLPLFQHKVFFPLHAFAEGYNLGTHLRSLRNQVEWLVHVLVMDSYQQKLTEMKKSLLSV